MTAPAPLPPGPQAREHAVGMFYDGVNTAAITAATGLTAEEITAAVDDDATIRRPAGRPVAAATPRPRALTPPPAPRATPVPADADKVRINIVVDEEPHGTITELITWAEHHDDTRIRTAATRIRDGLADLQRRRTNETAARAAIADVERLTAELTAAKDRARAAGARVARPAAAPYVRPKGHGREYYARVRAWAIETNRPVSSFGRPPASLCAQYDAAHPDETSTK